MNRLTLVMALLFLAGCSTSPGLYDTATKTVQMRHSAYLGKKMGLFIIGVGVPYAKKVSPTQHVYSWNSHTSSFYPQPLLENGDHWMDGECEIHIYTNTQDRITAIYAFENHAENWQIDACTRYLK